MGKTIEAWQAEAYSIFEEQNCPFTSSFFGRLNYEHCTFCCMNECKKGLIATPGGERRPTNWFRNRLRFSLQGPLNYALEFSDRLDTLKH